MSQPEHAKKFRCEACSTLSDFELLDESLVSKIEQEHTCPRCHASALQLLFSLSCSKCQIENLLSESLYQNYQNNIHAYKCEPCLAEEERLRREEEERKRKEEEERLRREEEERKRLEAERLKQEEEKRRREEEKRIQEELRLQAEKERIEEERERAEAQARAEEELRLAQLQHETKEIKQELPPEDLQQFKVLMEQKKGKKNDSNLLLVKAFFLTLFVAFILKIFIIDSFIIPSKSMMPTLLEGDYLFVNKLAYGLRLPFGKKWLYQSRMPRRGELVVFSWPTDERLDFIKRVVGLPGDKVRIDKRDLYVNDQKVKLYPVQVEGLDFQNIQKMKVNPDPQLGNDNKWLELPSVSDWKEFDYFVEDLQGVKYFIQQMKPLWPQETKEFVVPPSSFFVMGDNRDNSSDSRVWGFVPQENLRGKALFLWFSLDSEIVRSPWYKIEDWTKKIRWDRLGKAIN